MYVQQFFKIILITFGTDLVCTPGIYTPLGYIHCWDVYIAGIYTLLAYIYIYTPGIYALLGYTHFWNIYTPGIYTPLDSTCVASLVPADYQWASIAHWPRYGVKQLSFRTRTTEENDAH